MKKIITLITASFLSLCFSSDNILEIQATLNDKITDLAAKGNKLLILGNQNIKAFNILIGFLEHAEENEKIRLELSTSWNKYQEKYIELKGKIFEFNTTLKDFKAILSDIHAIFEKFQLTANLDQFYSGEKRFDKQKSDSLRFIGMLDEKKELIKQLIKKDAYENADIKAWWQPGGKWDQTKESNKNFNLEIAQWFKNHSDTENISGNAEVADAQAQDAPSDELHDSHTFIKIKLNK